MTDRVWSPEDIRDMLANRGEYQNRKGPTTRSRRSRALERAELHPCGDSTIAAGLSQGRRRLQSDDGSNIADCPISHERRKSGQRAGSRSGVIPLRPGPSGKPSLVEGHTNFALALAPPFPEGRGAPAKAERRDG